MLNLLPIGEFSIAKYTKHGVWVEAAGTKIFIHFSKTFTDPRTWSEEQSEPGIMSGLSAFIAENYADCERKEAAPFEWHCVSGCKRWRGKDR